MNDDYADKQWLREQPLNAARGIIRGIIYGSILWAGLLAIGIWMLHS